MRYLRLLLNSMLAGGIAAAYITLLFLHVNPEVPLRPGTVAPLAAILVMSYGLYLAAACFAAMLLWQMFGSARLSPAWVSLRVLAWLAAIVASGGAALMWLNLNGLRSALTSEAAQDMALGAAVITLCAAVFLMLALVRHSVRPERWPLGEALFATVLVTSLAAPLALRARGGPPPAPGRAPAITPFETPVGAARVMMLLVDGASLDYISPAVAEGRLPNLGRLLEGGAVMHLATLRPTQPEPVWTAVATGKLPAQTGLRSNARYPVGSAALDLLPDYCLAHALVHFGLLQAIRHTSEAVRTATLWDVLGGSGLSSAIVRWPLTYPARRIRGYVVSDRFHRTAAPAIELEGQSVLSPPTLGGELQARLDPSVTASAAAEAVDDPHPAAGALAVDRLYADVFAELLGKDVQFVALRYQAVDAVGHYYLRQAMPRAFGDVSDDEQRQFGRLLEQSYRYIDDEVGALVERLGPDDLLLVVSPFGMEPVRLPKRLLERVLGNAPLSGTHERAPDGFLMAYGARVRAGRLPRASVLDVAPTVLYFFGLPVARDMDGFARTDVFSRAFTDERPLTFIPTYDR